MNLDRMTRDGAEVKFSIVERLCGLKDRYFLRARDSWEAFLEEVNHEGPACILCVHGQLPGKCWKAMV